MTKKRFEMDDEGEYVIDNKTDDLYDACGGGDGLPFVIKEYHKLEKENEELKSEIEGMKELLKSYRKTIKHDAELLVDATKNGYLPPLEEWKEVEK